MMCRGQSVHNLQPTATPRHADRGVPYGAFPMAPSRFGACLSLSCLPRPQQPWLSPLSLGSLHASASLGGFGLAAILKEYQWSASMVGRAPQVRRHPAWYRIRGTPVGESHWRGSIGPGRSRGPTKVRSFSSPLFRRRSVGRGELDMFHLPRTFAVQQGVLGENQDRTDVGVAQRARLGVQGFDAVRVLPTRIYDTPLAGGT